MSHNSKNARRIVEAREMSKSRLAGNPGPKSTTPQHGKTRAWWQLGSYAEFVKGKPKKARKETASASVG